MDLGIMLVAWFVLVILAIIILVWWLPRHTHKKRAKILAKHLAEIDEADLRLQGVEDGRAFVIIRTSALRQIANNLPSDVGYLVSHSETWRNRRSHIHARNHGWALTAVRDYVQKWGPKKS